MADSREVVSALYDVDPGFGELVETLFGKAVDVQAAWEYLYAPDGVSKMTGPDAADLHVPQPIKAAKGILVPKPPQVPTSVPLPKPPTKAGGPSGSGVLKKALDEDLVSVTWEGEFAKFDTAKRQAFGWASVVELDGEPVLDLQGDFITADDLEDAAYGFVTKSRVGGSQHQRDMWDRPVQAGHLIESKVWTDEKYEAFAKSLGMDPALFASAPRGWEVGFQYEPGQTWDDIAKGVKTGFSIHGRGKRVAVEL